MKHAHPLYEQWAQCFECNKDRLHLKKCSLEALEKEEASRIKNTGEHPITPYYEIEGENRYADKDNKVVGIVNIYDELQNHWKTIDDDLKLEGPLSSESR